MNRYRSFTREELGSGIGVIYAVTFHCDNYDPSLSLKNPKRKANRRKAQRRARTGRRK